jgi:UDP-4-amino-4,6-dideoxy-N-acetyl-beta-L-altrosamine N-acetyltransferase
MEGTVQSNIIKYGVTLKRIIQSDIELVRTWRNDPKISKYMNYREIIDPEMQQKWFTTVNNSSNYYFLIMVDDKKIGLTNLKNIHYDEKTMEWGLFIYEDEYLGTLVPFQTGFCLFDFGFLELGIETSTSHILATNTNAIKFNKAFGFQLEDGQDGIKNQLYKLTKERYILNRDIILRKINKHLTNK